MALETKKRSLVTVEDITEWYVATAGFAKTSTTDSQLIPFVNAQGGLDIETETTKGPGQEDMAYGQGAKKVTAKIQTEASDLALWAALNAMVTPVTANNTITKDLNGDLFVYGKNRNGEFYNFWQKPDLQDFITAPACSTALSAMGTKWHNGNDARYIELNLSGWESAAMESYRCGLTAYDTTADQTATTSGATLVTASRAARVLNKGFHTVTIGGTDMGILSEASFEDELVGGQLQHNKHSVLQRKITYKAETVQASLTQQAAITALEDVDTTVVFKSYAGETLTVNNARIKSKHHLMQRGSKHYVSIEGSSTMSLSQAAYTGTTATYTCNA